jgi:hypothetical protein
LHNEEHVVLRTYQVIELAASLNLLLLPALGQAADLSKQEPIESVVEFGRAGGELVFAPNTPGFKTGITARRLS